MPTLAELAEKTKVAEELWMTTARAGGATAAFPLWFIHDGERLYILAAESGTEVWDVKANPRVRVAIGSAGSQDALNMTAEVMTDPSWVPMMLDMLRKKYGTQHKERLERTAEAARGGHFIIKLKPAP